MAGIGTFIMIGIVVGSISISLFLFLDQRLVDITEESGDSVTVNNLEFNISHIGNYESLEKSALQIDEAISIFSLFKFN